MNERFRIINPYGEDEPMMYDGNKHINLEEAIDMLNEQAEEIKFLKKILAQEGIRIIEI